jgi:hypothetical protein
MQPSTKTRKIQPGTAISLVPFYEAGIAPKPTTRAININLDQNSSDAHI